jgi:hypothetical protein
MFPRSTRPTITVAPEHRLSVLERTIDWTELEERAQLIRSQKLKNGAGKPPHLRALNGAMVLGAGRSMSFREAEDQIRHYGPARLLCGLTETDWTPDHNTIHDYAKLMGPEGMQLFNEYAVELAVEKGLADPRVMVADTTAQEAAIPHPNEMGLMAAFLAAVGAASQKAGGALQQFASKVDERPGAAAAYQLGNHLGSSSVELDKDGALIAYEEYHPYGTTSFQAGRSAAEVSLKRYRYTGKERDDESGFNLTRVLGVWLRALERFHRRRARRAVHDHVQGGYVSFVQRFGSAINLNVHIHTVCCDGTFAIDDDDVPRFVELPPPERDELELLLARVVMRVRRCLERRLDGHDEAPAEALDDLSAASLAGNRSPGRRREGRFAARTAPPPSRRSRPRRGPLVEPMTSAPSRGQEQVPLLLLASTHRHAGVRSHRRRECDPRPHFRLSLLNGVPHDSAVRE